jgi:uncharacterized protein
VKAKRERIMKARHNIVVPLSDVEVRTVEGSQSPLISGYAAVYNSESQDLGGFVEILSPGCFTKTLQENRTIKCLWNHDSNYVLGSVKNNTLTLKDTERGLYFECTPPETQYAKDFTESIKRGDVDNCSFMFQVIKDKWTMEDGKRIRYVNEAVLYEISTVAMPAYTATTVSARDLFSEIKEDISKKGFEARGAIAFHHYPLADENQAWNAGEVVKESDPKDLKIICAWYDSTAPDVKGSYKLPHHLGKAGDYKTVWHGVAAAMAALFGAQGGVEIPDKDKKAVYNHLASHYKEFKKDVPDYRSMEKSNFTDKEKEEIRQLILQLSLWVNDEDEDDETENVPDTDATQGTLPSSTNAQATQDMIECMSVNTDTSEKRSSDNDEADQKLQEIENWLFVNT